MIRAFKDWYNTTVRQKKTSESGSIFTTLFGAIAVVGLVGAGTVTLLQGPVKTMVSLNHQNLTQMRMEIASKLVMMDAMSNFLTYSDADTITDYIELSPYAAGPVTGGGVIPTSLNINDLDAWGTQMGYCTWDNGDDDDGRNDAGTGTDNRLNGQTTAEMDANPGAVRTEIIVLISAGPNRAFETGCYAYGDGGNEGVVKASGSDDLVISYRYDEALEMMGDLWVFAVDEDGSDETVVKTEQNVDLRADVAVAGLLQFNVANSGLVLSNSPGATCEVWQINQLFLDTGTSPPSVVLCKADGTVEPIAGSTGEVENPGLTTTVNQNSLNLSMYHWGGSFGTSPTKATGEAAEFIAVSGGYNDGSAIGHGCGLKADGTVWCWGDGENGRLGNGATSDLTLANTTQVSNIANIVQITSGRNHSCALENDGDVWCWGGNTAGELGNGTTTQSTIPVEVSGLSNIVFIDTSDNGQTNCALDTSNRVWCWGSDSQGQLGNDATIGSYSTTPVQVSGITDFVDVAVGTPHACGLRKNGEIWCWGGSDEGQLGNGQTGVNSGVPVQVTTTENFVKLDANYEYSCAISDKRELWCWGADFGGSLGNGADGNSAVPALTDDTEQDYVDIYRFCALKSDGRAFCQGWGAYSGDGNGADNPSPSEVITVNSFISIHGSGSAQMWGLARAPQIGEQTPPTSAYTIGQAPDTGGTIESHGLSITRNSAASGQEAGIGFAIDATSIGSSNTLSAAISGQYRTSDGTALAFRTQDSGGGTAGTKAAFDPEGNFGTHGTNAANDAILVTGPTNSINWNSDYTYGLLVTNNSYASDQIGYFGLDESTGNTLILFSKDFYIASSNAEGSTLQSMAYFLSGNPIELYADLTLSSGNYRTLTTSAYSNSVNDIPMLRFDRYGGSSGSPSSIPANAEMGRVIFSGHDGSTQDADGQAFIGAENNGSIGSGTTGTTLKIGTASNGSPVDRLIIESDGDVAINRSTAEHPLHVGGRGAADSGIKIGNDSSCGGSDEGTLRYNGTNIQYCDGSSWVDFDGAGEGAGNPGSTENKSCAHEENFIQLAFGQEFACGLYNNGRVSCWGWNEDGSLGKGLTANGAHYPPVVNSKLLISHAKYLDTGGFGGCIITEEGRAKCWGENVDGKLGRGYAGGFSAIPDYVLTNEQFKQIDVGKNHVCGVTENNGIRCWGDGFRGRLGNDSELDQSTPVSVIGVGDAVKVVAGDRHSCAILSDRSVQCWGQNVNGELGIGSTSTNENTPQDVSITDVVDITLGGNQGTTDFTCALQDNGTVWCWGDNSQHQLGNGSGSDRSSPTQVSGLTDVIDIAAGTNHVVALRDNGSIHVWGTDDYGELGLGSPGTTTPVAISGVSTAVAISDNSTHAESICFILADGTPRCIGKNTDGALGDGTATNTNTPVDVLNPLACDAEKIAFVTSEGSNGDLGGIEGADAWCQRLADDANLPGTYYAWLGVEGYTPENRFLRYADAIVMPNGTKIADNWADLTDGTLDSSLNRDENGISRGGLNVYTNVNSDGTIEGTNPTTDNCANFTSNSAASQTNLGRTDNTGGIWTNNNNTSCNSTNPIFCFQQ